MKHRATVFVFAPRDFAYSREVVRGVRAYALGHDRWSLRSGSVPRPQALQHLNPGPHGGSICFFATPELEDQLLLHHRAPAINVSYNQPASRLPRVLPDNTQVGRLAARHLLDRGFRNFGFFAQPGHGYAQARYAGFRQALAAEGYGDVPLGTPPQLGQWLAGLPKPVGILAATDALGQKLIDYCHESDIAVPEQVAVIGVDNDEHVCESCVVSLSSVDTRGFHVGIKAAELLDAMMQGAPAPTEPVLVPCGSVISRRSTDTTAVADPDLRFAMRYIREHACGRMSVEDIMEHLRISRRTLEKRFKSEFGRTLHDEVKRVRLERARELLVETTLNVEAIADRAGFCDRKVLTRVFGESFGMPPGEYRTTHRRGV